MEAARPRAAAKEFLSQVQLIYQHLSGELCFYLENATLKLCQLVANISQRSCWEMMWLAEMARYRLGCVPHPTDCSERATGLAQRDRRFRHRTERETH